jgi:hypothetical protein
LPFPDDIVQQVVSDDNPAGTLTNSDLEMAGVVLHYAALQNHLAQHGESMEHTRAGVFCDNTPAVYWTGRMADRAETATASHLLRGMAVYQRSLQAGPLTVAHLAGVENDMADVASRSFNDPATAHCDTAFLTMFSTRFPQTTSWTLVNPANEILSAVISTLQGTRLQMQRWTTKPARRHGQTGPTTPINASATHSYEGSPIPCKRKYCSASLLGSGRGTTAEEIRSELNPWKKRCYTYHKQSCWVDTETHEDYSQAASQHP